MTISQYICYLQRDKIIMNDTIQIFITGGTFDKSYNYRDGNLILKKLTFLKCSKEVDVKLDIDIKTLMMIDSLEMNQTHIDSIIYNCKNCKSNKIIITHGTDRMVKSAQEIEKANLKNKTIILTGAMIPYAFGSSSDGFFNLGCALSFGVQSLKKWSLYYNARTIL